MLWDTLMTTTYPSSQMLTVGVVTVLSAWLALVGLRKRRVGNTPPGPRGWPIIGNALDIPAKNPWITYLQWSRNYNSDLLCLRLPGFSMIILNSAKAVNDLMIKRSFIYSDRPQSTMLQLMGMGWIFGLMHYGDLWKMHRKIFHREFETELETVRLHELQSVRRLLARLLKSKVNYARDLQLTTGDAILSVTYGISVKSEDDYFIKLAESLVSALTDVAREPYLVDMFPFLRLVPSWFPGAKFQKQAENWNRLGQETRNAPFEHVKSEAERGRAVPSVALRLLGSLQEGTSECSEEYLRNILAEAYLGGAGATVGTLCSFVLAMALNPDVQKKAQAEVDKVFRKQRLPDFSDYGQIPYLDALVNEVLRWNPGAPLGLFHATTKDDIYDGYHIPKGSIVVPNVWAVLHDESIYGSDHDKFIPERFLTADGLRNPDVPDADAAFGFGRRMCPGRVMGRNMLWITAASLLTTFDISDPIGRDGKPLESASIEYTNSMSSRPPYFDCTFRLRAGISEHLIWNGLGEEN